ncbi:sugar phosphate isomerase/epimerase [Shinella sp. S4-D37]|uniref:sugar phosphate isomerase/epimerase family protein n=1 Tax=Shinella sp. S4-D37 TaxID=3161999 RepID=UPI0034663A2A
MTSPVLSMAALTMIDAEPTEFVRACAAAGFDAVGLRLVAPPAAAVFHSIVDRPAVVREIEAVLDANGMRVNDIESMIIGPDTDLSSFEPAFALGQKWGVGLAITAIDDPDVSHAIDMFGRYCELAGSYGIQASLEFVPYWGLVTDLPKALRLIRAVPEAVRPGLLVDALHLARSGGKPSDLDGLDPGLFNFVHLCDAPSVPPRPDDLREESRYERLYPGDGELPLFDLLDRMAPHTVCSVEAPCARYQHLDFQARARLCADKTRAVLAQHTARNPGTPVSATSGKERS